MIWGNVSKDATRTMNEDTTYRYKVQMSQMVTMWNNGMEITCRVRPTHGSMVSVGKQIVVHGLYTHLQSRCMISFSSEQSIC